MSYLTRMWKKSADYAVGYADGFNDGLFDEEYSSSEAYRAGFDAGAWDAETQTDFRRLFDDDL